MVLPSGFGTTSGWLDAEREDVGYLTITHRASGIRLYQGYGDGVCIRDGVEFPDSLTLFLDRKGRDLAKAWLDSRGWTSDLAYYYPVATAAEVVASRQTGEARVHVSDEWAAWAGQEIRALRDEVADLKRTLRGSPF